MAKIINFKDGEGIIAVSGTIIEKGSNSNGEYIKFGDGTLICMHSSVTGNLNTIAHYTTYNWTYPHQFISVPRVYATPMNWSTAMCTTKVWPRAEQSDIMIHQILLDSMKPYDNTSQINLLAIGKWK